MYDAMTTIYFSPTGGTALAARQMREAFGLPGADIDVTGPQAVVTPRTFGPGELVLFAAPVYAGRVPAVEGLFGLFTGSGTPCVLVLAYGNRHYDEAAAQLKRRLERQGFVCVGAVWPHYAPHFCKGSVRRPAGRGRPRRVRRLCRRGEGEAGRGGACFRAGARRPGAGAEACWPGAPRTG